MADGRHFENRYDVMTLRRTPNFDEMWCADGKPHTDDSEKGKIRNQN